ncbi:MAG TPA: transporter [Peptococcaceae bacterium]|nr:transporter [Peptococcaceae bacterium]
MQEQNDEVRRRVREFLEANQNLNPYGIRAEVADGIVVLTGIVDTLADKEKLATAVAGLPGVREIRNNISISTDGAVTDAEVLEEVMEELAAEPGIDLKRIGARVIGGRVFLCGRAESEAEEKAARKAAARARGVREVHSRVEIGPPDSPFTLEEIFHSQVRNDHETSAR